MNLTIGIFHDNDIGQKLGKKGTESDMLFFNRKEGEDILTFIQPMADKLLPKCEMMSVLDAAIISLAEITKEAGETVLLLDSLGIQKGLILAPAFSDTSKIAGLVKGTALERFPIMEPSPEKVLEAIKKIEPSRDSNSPAAVLIDHSFSVKGVGEVILGFVKRGTVRKHDNLQLLPAGKTVSVRSIQMHDKDFDEAGTGSRVGICVKGAVVDEMRRGSVMAAPGSYKSGQKITLSFQRNRFYAEPLKEGTFHIAIGMQTAPVKLSAITPETVTIETEKPLAYSQADTFLLLDINSKKLHLMGKGKAI